MVQSIKNLIAAVLISISGFFLWTQVLPAYDTTSGLEALISEKEMLLEGKNEILKKIKDLSEENDRRYAELQRLSLVIPKTKSLPEVISMIESIFSQTGNTLGEYIISDSSVRGESLKKINLSIGSSGTYESLLNLLNAIEKNIRLFDLTSLSITEDLESGISERLNFQIKGNIYWLQPVEGSSVKDKPAAGNNENGS